MAGQTHELITALVVIEGERTFRHTDVTELANAAAFACGDQRYVAADQPLDCAGCYKLESRGIVLFEKIEIGRSHGRHGAAIDRLDDDPARAGIMRFREVVPRASSEPRPLDKADGGGCNCVSMCP